MKKISFFKSQSFFSLIKSFLTFFLISFFLFNNFSWGLSGKGLSNESSLEDKMDEESLLWAYSGDAVRELIKQLRDIQREKQLEREPEIKKPEQEPLGPTNESREIDLENISDEELLLLAEENEEFLLLAMDSDEVWRMIDQLKDISNTRKKENEDIEIKQIQEPLEPTNESRKIDLENTSDEELLLLADSRAAWNMYIILRRVLEDKIRNERMPDGSEIEIKKPDQELLESTNESREIDLENISNEELLLLAEENDYLEFAQIYIENYMYTDEEDH